MSPIPFFGFVLREPARSASREVEPLPSLPSDPELRRVLIVGNPNVGKSVVFNRLTGRYVTVSNYPGTTVEVSRGRTAIEGAPYEIVDTPGMYSLRPISEEERVGRALLLREPAHVVLHVLDAKNVERMLPFTLQLIEAGLPVVVAANMLDEAESLGVRLDLPALASALGVPVVGAVALTGRGIDVLRSAIHKRADERSAQLLQV
jgi:ferrous iron transport protein B